MVEADSFQLTSYHVPPDAGQNHSDSYLALFGLKMLIDRSIMLLSWRMKSVRVEATARIFIDRRCSLRTESLDEKVEDTGSPF
jgi:hypothetical protein